MVPVKIKCGKYSVECFADTDLNTCQFSFCSFPLFLFRRRLIHYTFVTLLSSDYTEMLLRKGQVKKSIYFYVFVPNWELMFKKTILEGPAQQPQAARVPWCTLWVFVGPCPATPGSQEHLWTM